MSVKKNALSIPPLNAPIELSLNICMNCHICLCVVSELRQPFSTTHQKTNEIRCIIDKTSIYSNKMVSILLLFFEQNLKLFSRNTNTYISEN